MITLLVYLVVFVIVVSVAWYVIQQIRLPDPLRTWVVMVFIVIGAIVLIWLILQFTGVTMPALK